ncbi:MAG: ParA family protein, partial [Syntrophomonadaceae bacterium]|nr:ParA family protein [Syntrophomonadaceae bacterium]
MRIIALSNQKGGTGKTTSTINIGVALALSGYQVLLVDLDPQANLTYSLGVNALEIAETVGRLLLDESMPDEIVLNRGGVQIIPSTPQLYSIESELYLKPDYGYMLKRSLEKFTHYDYILLDCPPSAGIFTQNALLAASEIFIPVQAEYLALQGMSMLLNTLDNIRKDSNPDLKLGGIIATRYDHRKVLNREVIEKLQQHFGDLLFKTIIRENISLAEAPSYGLDIFSYRPNSSGAKDYRRLAAEIAERSL